MYPFFKKKKKNYGLTKECLPKNKQWLVECDYADKLSEHDLLWLDLFNREFNEGAIKKGDGTALHFEDHLRKEAYRDNSRRSRDLYAIKQCGGILFDLDYTMGQEQNMDDQIDQNTITAPGRVLFLQYCTELLQIHYTSLQAQLQSSRKPVCTGS